MFIDRAMARTWRSGTARDHAIDILVGAWSGEPADRRAAVLAARGDIPRAGDCGGPGWKCLANNDVIGALRAARQREGSKPQSLSMALLEAEALFAAGAVVGSLNRLRDLQRRGDPPATMALARRRHLLGDHDGAESVAASLPSHAHTALIGARAALALERPARAMRFIEPFMEAMAPLPEPGVAGAFAAVAATVLARFRDYTGLKGFAASLLAAPDLDSDMIPGVARAAWTGGLGGEAWKRFNGDDPWLVAARAELAMLSGRVDLAGQLIARAGAIGAPAQPGLLLLTGRKPDPKEAEQLFTPDRSLHLWRTHPYRWQPWIDAACGQGAQVEIYDLARGEIPDEQDIPGGTLNDGSLIELVEPKPVQPLPVQGTGAWVDLSLCQGIGVGHDWPTGETRVLEERLTRTNWESAAVWVMSADAALPHMHEGRPIVAVAPPGDPFWNGPLPERAWPALRIVRQNPSEGWRGAGERIAALVDELLHAGGDPPGSGLFQAGGDPPAPPGSGLLDTDS